MKKLSLLVFLVLFSAGCLAQANSATIPTVTPSATAQLTATAVPFTPTLIPTNTPTVNASPVASPVANKTSTPTPNNKFTPVPLGSAKEIERGNAQRKEIALTFDAGSGATNTASILKTLHDNTITATVFLTGQWVDQNPQLVKQIADAGHELGNHTYSHPDLTTVSDGEIISQFAKTEAAVQKVTGKTTKPFFRPPFGARNQKVLAVASGQGYQSVYWTFDSGDWRTDLTAQQVYDRVVSQAVNGAIIVMHIDSALTAEMLPREIQQLKAKGFSFVTVSQIMRP